MPPVALPLTRWSARILVAAAACLSVLGCDGDSAQPLVPEINQPVAASIEVAPSSIAFDASGATERVRATVRDANGTVIAGAAVEWSTTSSAVTLAVPTVIAADGPRVAAAVTAQTGPDIIVVAVSRGAATVTAKSGAVSTPFLVTVAPIPAQLVIVSGNQQSGSVGSTLSQPLAIKVLDRLGNPIAGQTVTFTPAAGSGTLANATTTTNSDGIASTTWTLGMLAGTQEITVSVAGANITQRFTATGLPGPAAKITVQSGANQSAPGGTTLPVAPAVRITDQFDNPVTGVTVVFAVSGGGGTITGATAVTDANGVAAVGSWTLGSVAGTNTLTASIAGNPEITTTISATSTGAAGFSITLRFLSTMTTSQQIAFSAAAAKWAGIITGDLPDVPASISAGQCGTNSSAINETIDDVLIFATVTSIDGAGSVLGSAGPCFVRSGANGLTVIGEMLFDEADVSRLESQGLFASVVVHEMGHVLGIGTFWSEFGLQNPSPVGGPPRDTFFPGANAIAGFNAIGGSTYTGGQKVPVENAGSAGTINAHWRESTFGNELMTGFVNIGPNPLSLLTVRSLQDLGYVVNTNAADAYSVTLSLRQGPEPDAIPLVNDIRAGPVFAIDTSGRIRRIR